MKEISMLDFRLHAKMILSRIKRGERLVLTRRGKPVARLEPLEDAEIREDDPFYTLGDLAVDGEGLSNEEIDKILYGQ